jgi:ComF family protein
VYLHLLGDLIDVLLPAVCLACGRRLRRSDGALPLCGTCAAALERRRRCGEVFELDGVPVLAAFDYRYPLTALVPAAKFRGLPSLFTRLAPGLVSAVRRAGLVRWGECVVPVPLHPARRRERGYDQAFLLARRVGVELGLPVVAGALRRRRPTPPLKRVGSGEREQAVRGAFLPGPEATRVEGRRVLLVDDIATTGATLQAAAAALREAGPASLLGLVVARTPPPSSSGRDLIPGGGAGPARRRPPGPERDSVTP